MSERTPFKRKGAEIRNPENPEEGYRLTMDVFSGEVTRADQFQAFGGAPEVKPGDMPPVWLGRALGFYK